MARSTVLPGRALAARDARAFVRFVIVGIGANLLAFALYLAATDLGLIPVVAAAIAWLAAVAAAFTANRGWTFRDRGARGPAFVRYGALYGAAFVAHLVLLVLFVDVLGQPHERVQLILMVAAGLALFVGQRTWVFRHMAEA